MIFKNALYKCLILETEKNLRKHSLQGGNKASDLLKLFIKGTKNATFLMPIAYELNSKIKQHAIYDSTFYITSEWCSTSQHCKAATQAPAGVS